ncbi:MAG: hypothetical protein ACO3JL_14265 [Myxococcota bacterium]
MTRPDDDNLLIAYVYDELAASDRDAFEARLAADPALQAEVEGLLATRSMLGADARFGEQTGLDEPPPHLRQAILQAEVLARPREIRAAAASAAPQGFLLRLSTWWIGGGLAASAAAAVLLLVRESPDTEDLSLESAPSAQLAKASADAIAADSRAAAQAAARGAPPEAPAEAPEGDEGGSGSASAERAVASPVGSASGGPGGRSLGLAGAGSAGGGSAAGVIGGLAQHDAALGFAGASDIRELDDTPQADAATAAPSGGAAPKGLAEAEALWEPPSAAEAAADNEGRAEAKASRSAGAPPAPAPEAPAASAPVRLPGPPPLPAVVKAELARGRAAAKKRDESRRKQKSAVPQAAGPQDQANPLGMELEQGLLAGAQELAAGRPFDALEIFRGVASRDPRGVFVGVAAYVGQMRALVALKRSQEALALLPLVRRAEPKASGVSEGVQVAAEAAEQMGDRALAVSLYRELRRDPARRVAADRALARLQAQEPVSSKAAVADAP